jgi:hypothetical protein
MYCAMCNIIVASIPTFRQHALSRLGTLRLNRGLGFALKDARYVLCVGAYALRLCTCNGVMYMRDNSMGASSLRGANFLSYARG